MAITEITMGQRKDSGTVLTVVRGDNRAHILRMKLNRVYGGIDLGPLAWNVAVANANSEVGVYALENVTVEEDRIIFDWIVSGKATTAVGKTRFELEGIGQDSNGKAVIFQTASRVITVLEDVNAEPEMTDDVLDAYQTALLEAHNAATAAREAARATEADRTTTGEYMEQASESAAYTHDEAERAKDEADRSAHFAIMANEMAETHGFCYFEIDENGCLIYTRTDGLRDIHFELDEGRLVIVYG